jgi:hypothetical protein
LRLKDGNKAAGEFQKIPDHRGLGPSSELYPLAHLQLALALQGDTAKARLAYQEFLTLWERRRSRCSRSCLSKSRIRETAVANYRWCMRCGLIRESSKRFFDHR